MTHDPDPALERGIDKVIDTVIPLLSAKPGIARITPHAPSYGTHITNFKLRATAWTAAMTRERVEWVFSAYNSKLLNNIDPMPEILEELSLRIQLQEQRTALATAHGLHNYEDERLSPAHFTIDRSLATILAERSICAGSLVSWHRTNSADQAVTRSVHSIADYGRTIEQVAVGTHPTTNEAILAPIVKLTGKSDVTATLYDRNVTIGAAMPDTAVIAAIGRPLGDIVATGHDHIDSRIIEYAEASQSGSCIFTLVPDRISVLEADAMPRPSRMPRRIP